MAPSPVFVPMAPSTCPPLPPPFTGGPPPLLVPLPLPVSPVPPCPIPPPPPPLSAGVPVAGVTLTAQPPGGQVAEGEGLVLSCTAGGATRPLVFSWYREGQGPAPGPGIPLRAAGGAGRRTAATTCAGPPTASPRPTAPSCRSPSWCPWPVPPCGWRGTEAAVTEALGTEGERLNLSCAVRVGTAPVAFRWLRDGEEVGEGPLLALGPLGQGHVGSYQCVATNRLGAQRAFQERSPPVALSVTPWGHGQRRGRALAGGLSASLLVLLAACAALGWYLLVAAAPSGQKSQERDPAAPRCPRAPSVLSMETAEPEYSNVSPQDVVYAAVIVTEQGGGGPAPPGAPQEPSVTYAVLPGPRGAGTPRGLCRVPSDSYENVACA
nr:Fc receptor-like protein 3 [Anas platyrhynchos]